MKYFVAIFFTFIAWSHVSAFYNYKTCKQKKKGIHKECRNLTCKYGKDCVYNSLYNKNWDGKSEE